MAVSQPTEQAIIYPESDGKPIADNTLQLQYIRLLLDGLDALFADNPNVFIAGDLLWYPVESEPRINTAPDAMVVFGRPKGHRRSYLQWQEDNIPPQVVLEILSMSNRVTEMTRKFVFYQRYGVEEYYLYDPDRGDLGGWLRYEQELAPIENMESWVSPRLGMRFELVNGELQLYMPDGQRVTTYADQQRQKQEAQQRAEQAEQRAERLAAQLRALGITPEEQ